MRERTTDIVHKYPIVSVVASAAVIILSYLNYSDSPLQSLLLIIIWFSAILLNKTEVDKYRITAIWGLIPFIGGIYLYTTGTNDILLVSIATGIGLIILIDSVRNMALTS